MAYGIASSALYLRQCKPSALIVYIYGKFQIYTWLLSATTDSFVMFHSYPSKYCIICY
jgi:hypothetical protein